MKKYLFIAIVVMAVMIAFLINSVSNLKDEKNRLNSNQSALLDTVMHYKLKNGQYATSVQSLQLTKKELEENCSDLTAQIKALNIKLKRVEAASQTAMEMAAKIETIVRDSIVYRDRIDPIQVFKWKDPWVSFTGSIERGNLSASLVSIDTLTQVIHRVPKQWWFIKYGTKGINQVIKCSNPHTRIVYSEYIEITNKRGCKR